MVDSINEVSKIVVEVVYAKPEKQTLQKIIVALGSTAEEAIEQSGILGEYQEIDLAQNKIGLFGKMIKLNQVLREKDRVEIYRPLIADPKEVRKRRATEGKALKKGGG